MHQRLLIFVGMVLMVGLAGFAIDHRHPAPQPVASGPPAATYSPEPLPKPNILGSQIRVAGNAPGDHPEPEILPRSPLNLVIDDCKGLPRFETDGSSLDSERKVLLISWWDPGVKNNRYLTVLLTSPSCRARFSTYGG